MRRSTKRSSGKRLGGTRHTYSVLEQRQMLTADIGLGQAVISVDLSDDGVQVYRLTTGDDWDINYLSEEQTHAEPPPEPLIETMSPEELAAIRFSAIEFQQTPATFSGDQIWREFSLDGIVEDAPGVKLPSQIDHAVYNPVTETIFGVSRNELFEFDPQTGEVRLHRMNGDFASPSSLSGITFDSTRNRILIAAQGGSGSSALFEFTVDDGQWGELSGFNNRSARHATLDYASIAHDAESDTLWMIREHGGALLTAHDHTGKITRTVNFGDQIPFEEVWLFDVTKQLTFENGNLVFVSVLHKDPSDLSNIRQAEQIVYFLDPDSATATETSRKVLDGSNTNDNFSTPFDSKLPVHIPEVNESLDLDSLFEDVDEVHMVSFYTNSTSERATVVIDRPGKTVGLVLSSYDRARWNVEVTEGTTIKSVLLGGHQRQSITGLGGDVQIVDATFENSELPERQFIDAPDSIHSVEFRNAIDKIYKLTNVKISSFSGGSYGYTAPIIVNAVSDDPILNPGFPDAVDPAELPEYEFRGVEYVDELNEAGVYGRVAYLVYYSLIGPSSEAIRIELPRTQSQTYVDGQPVAFDAPLGKDYAIVQDSNTLIVSNRRQIFEVDLSTGEYSTLDWPSDDARTDSISAMTYDPIENRLIVAIDKASWQDDLSLESYSFETGEWSTFASFAHSQIEAMAFDAESGNIWALKSSMFQLGAPKLVAIDDQGVVIDTIDFDDGVLPDLMSEGMVLNSPQLFVQDGKIVYLSSAADPRNVENGMGYDRAVMYLIDPADDSVQLTWVSDSPDHSGDHGIDDSVTLDLEKKVAETEEGEKKSTLPGPSPIGEAPVELIQRVAEAPSFSAVPNSDKVCFDDNAKSESTLIRTPAALIDFVFTDQQFDFAVQDSNNEDSLQARDIELAPVEPLSLTLAISPASEIKGQQLETFTAADFEYKFESIQNSDLVKLRPNFFELEEVS